MFKSLSRASVFFFGATILSILILLFKKTEIGIDFIGGIMLNFDVKSNKDTEIKMDDLNDKLSNTLKKQFVLQNSGKNSFSLKINLGSKEAPKQSDSNNINEIKNLVRKSVDGDVVFHNADYMGPQISQKLIGQSIFAIVMSFFVIMLYLFIQFNIPLAISGVIVLICDIIISAGFASLLGFEFNLTLTAGFLTLIGYCINDTVVLYDRIRFNMNSSNKTIPQLVKSSVREVLRRSIITSLVTMYAVFGILFFADKSIKEFGVIVIIGILSGTFGSVFVASNLPLVFGLTRKKKSTTKRDKMFYAS